MTSTRERESRSVNSINQRMLSGLLTITMLHKRYHYRHVSFTTYICGERHGSCQMNMLCYSCLNYTYDAADDGIVFLAHYPTSLSVNWRRIGLKELWVMQKINLIREFYQSMIFSRFTTLEINCMTHLGLQKYMTYV